MLEERPCSNLAKSEDVIGMPHKLSYIAQSSRPTVPQVRGGSRLSMLM